MNAKDYRNPKQEESDLAKFVKLHTVGLQAAADLNLINEAVHSWLKQNNLVVPEEASEYLVVALLDIVRRARDGEGKPTEAEVRASLEARVRHAMEHNASPTAKRALPVLDLTDFPEVFAKYSKLAT